jgi:hypothetical protein
MAKTRPEKQVQLQVEACDKKNEELKKENQGYLAPRLDGSICLFTKRLTKSWKQKMRKFGICLNFLLLI